MFSTTNMKDIFEKNIFQLLILVAVINIGNGANILVMIPMPFKSHSMNFMPIFKELALRGHNVTVVSPFPQKTPVPNLTDIVVPNILEKFMAQTPVTDPKEMDGFLFKLIGLWQFGFAGMDMAFQLEQVQRFIKDTDSKFDLIIAEIWFIQEPFVAFGHKYNAPVIGIMPAFFFPYAAHFTGNALPISYSPLNKFGFNDHMTFLERAQNFLYYYWDVCVGDFYYLNRQDTLMRKYFKYPGSENLPSLQDMLRNTALTLLDHNMAIGYPVPLQKNVALYGGINIKNPEKLPADLQKIMDNAKEGVIYFSFGSFFNMSALKQEVQDGIISALGKSKRTVLMKLEDSTILKKYPYKNIILKSWFPQSSVLAHPNCKVFITHGGIHGLMEGIYHAVPLLAIPLFADQRYNARLIETVKIGSVLDKQSIDEEKLSRAINDLLNNPIYSDNVKERSAIFKDNPMEIMDNVIYWIEYVIRHKGAPHLRPAVLDMHWYQYLMLDVIAFYLCVVFLVLYIIKIIVKLLLCCLKCLFFRSRTCNKSIKKSKKE